MKNIKVRSSWVILSVVLIGIAVSFISWKHDIKSLPPVDYIKYVNNTKNGLKINKHMDEVNYSMQYRTADYQVTNEQKDPHLKTEVWKKEKQKYDDLEYYVLQIQSAKTNQDVLTLNLNSEEEYLQRQKYYSFSFKDDIRMVEGNDTLEVRHF